MIHADHVQPGGAGQPLVVKNVERIEAIIVPGEDKRRDAVLYTYVFSRMMRRDFNLTSIKLFFFCKKDDQRQLVRQHLLSLKEEAIVLADSAYRYEMPRGQVYSSTVMRIITDEADQLFEALLLADRSLYKLMHSPMAEVAEENLIPFMRAYNSLRQKVIGFPPPTVANTQSAIEQP
jgi:hypothetical protein